ncbi:MAG TPA: GAF domain-containing protein [Blastocatellia bacterium]|nr:GAF domain-containing protein [Blastocatellia bacterium]
MENERVDWLRRRIEELVQARVGLLEQDISRLQREVNESFNRLLEQTDVAASWPDQDEAFTQITAEVSAQIDQAGAESVRLGADIALLRDSVAELDEQRTQAEVLNALVARAANFAPRVVLFVVKGGNAVAWAARGLDEAATNNSIRGTSIPLGSDTVLRTALHSQQTIYGSPDLQPENKSLFGRLGKIHPERVLTVPLKVRGKTAALIYADSAERGEVATNVEAIELLAHTAGLVVELVSLRARMSEAPQPAKQSATTSQAPEPVAATTATAGSGALPRSPGVTGDFSAQPPSGDLQPDAPPPTFFATATQTVDTAPESSAQESSTSAQESGTSAMPATGVAGEEEKAHNDARRFARLLVSEIKLYNEHKVAEGRRGGDLYDRLKEDIDRSRQMYEKRVTPNVAAKFDYFYDELVSTLAEGDPSKLGSDCPGPSVVATT